MSAVSHCVVEFVGGPLDGHQQSVSLASDELEDFVLLPVGTILALLYRDRAFLAIRNPAVYQLDLVRRGHPSYRHVDSISAHVC